MLKLSKKTNALCAILVLASIFLGPLGRVTAAEGVSPLSTGSYYNLYGSMSPQFQTGYGQTFSSQVQAANGNLNIVNSAYLGAINYAAQNSDPIAAQNLIKVYQGSFLPILNTQFSLTDPENPSNLNVVGTVVQRALAPAIADLAGVMQNGRYVATAENNRKVAIAYQTLAAIQGNQVARDQLASYGINTALNEVLGTENVNVLNIMQGARTLLSGTASAGQEARAAVGIINSLGLDPNVSKPLSLVLGSVLSGNDLGSQLGTALGGVISGIPQLQGVLGNIINGVIGGQGAGNVGETLKNAVIGEMLSGLTNSRSAGGIAGQVTSLIGRSIQLPAGAEQIVSGMTGNLTNAAASATGLAKNLSTDLAGTPGAKAVEALGSGASGNPATEAANQQAAAQAGGGAACSAGASGTPAAGAGATRADGTNATGNLNPDGTVSGPNGEKYRPEALEAAMTGEDVVKVGDTYYTKDQLNSPYALPGESGRQYLLRADVPASEIAEMGPNLDAPGSATQFADLAPTASGSGTGSGTGTGTSGGTRDTAGSNPAATRNTPTAPAEGQTIRDYLIANGKSPERTDEILREYNLDPNTPATEVAQMPSSGGSGGGTSGTQTPIVPEQNQTVREYLIANGQTPSHADEVLRSYNLDPNTPASEVAQMPATQTTNGTTVRKPSLGSQLGAIVLQNLVGRATEAVFGGGSSGGNAGGGSGGGGGYTAGSGGTSGQTQTRIVPPAFTEATLQAQLRTELLRQMESATHLTAPTGNNISKTVGLSPAPNGTAMTAGFGAQMTNQLTNTGTAMANSFVRSATGGLIPSASTMLTGGVGNFVKNAATQVATQYVQRFMTEQLSKISGLAMGGVMGGVMGGAAGTLTGATLAGVPGFSGIGGNKGVPVQVQKGAYFTLVEQIKKNTDVLVVESRKQTKIQDEICKIQRRFEKSKYEIDPAAAKKIKAAQDKSDEATKKQVAEKLVTDWAKYLRDRRLDAVTRDNAKNNAVNSCAATKEALAAQSKKIEEIVKDPNSYSQTLSCPAGAETVLAKIYSNPSSLTIAEISIASIPTYNRGYQQIRGLERARAIIEESDKITLAQLMVTKGMEPPTDKEILRSNADTGAAGGGSGAGAGTPPKITVPPSLAAAEAERIAERPGDRSLVAPDTEEKKSLANDAPEGKTQQTLRNFTATTQQGGGPGPGNGDINNSRPTTPANNVTRTGGDWDWMKILGVSYSLFCGVIDPSSGICPGGGNTNPPEPVQSVVVPALTMVSQDATINGLLTTGITWGAEGVNSCTFTTDWPSYGLGTSILTTSSNIHAVGSAAELTGTALISHPGVYKIAAEQVTAAGTHIPNQVSAFTTSVLKTYPAPTSPDKTFINQETVYAPVIPTRITAGDRLYFSLDDQTTSVPLNAGETATSLVLKLSQKLSQLPNTSSIYQLMRAKHIVPHISPSGNTLIFAGDTMVPGVMPAGATYEISCTPNNGSSVLKKSVSVNFYGQAVNQPHIYQTCASGLCAE